jgi:hypothetical protein
VKNFLLTMIGATALVLGPLGVGSAHANVILSFTQNGTGNVVIGTRSGTSTTIKVTNAAVTVGSYAEDGTPFSGYLNLNVTNTGSAFNFSGNLFQSYSGTFKISSGMNGIGTDYLSATFTGTAFGANGGSTLTLSGSEPGDTITFASDLIPSTDLQDPKGISFSLSNLAPALHITSTTFASFTASISGNMSSNFDNQISEPAVALVLASGLLGLVALRRRG